MLIEGCRSVFFYYEHGLLITGHVAPQVNPDSPQQTLRVNNNSLGAMAEPTSSSSPRARTNLNHDSDLPPTKVATFNDHDIYVGSWTDGSDTDWQRRQRFVNFIQRLTQINAR